MATLSDVNREIDQPQPAAPTRAFAVLLSPGPGATAVPDDDAEHGRGLLIVGALADRWGVVPGPCPRKTVWAEIDLGAEPEFRH